MVIKRLRVNLLCMPGYSLPSVSTVRSATSELGVQVLQADAFYDVDGVDDIAQALGHFASMCISNHVVQIDRVERQFSCKALQHTSSRKVPKDCQIW